MGGVDAALLQLQLYHVEAFKIAPSPRLHGFAEHSHHSPACLPIMVMLPKCGALSGCNPRSALRAWRLRVAAIVIAVEFGPSSARHSNALATGPQLFWGALGVPFKCS